MPQNNEGTALWRRSGLMPGYSANQFFITSSNKHPKETLQFIDWWLDNGERAITNRFGPRGYSWDYVEDGKWTELPNIPTGEVRTMANSTLKSPWAHGIPYWCFADFWNQKRITAPPALARQGTFGAKGSYMDHASVGLPVLTYSEDENQEIVEIKTDLFNHVNTSFARFVREGVTDAQWQDYLNKLEGFGMARYVELYNKYYELFNR